MPKVSVAKFKKSVMENFELNDLSILALVGLFVCVIPYLQFLGILVVFIAFILNAIKLGDKKRRKSLVINIAICVLSLILFMVTDHLYYNDTSSPDTSASQTSEQAKPQPSAQEEAERKAQEAAQIKAQEEATRVAKEQAAAKQIQIDSAQFIGSRDLALVIKNPDNHKGEIFKIWGKITQFDAATGTSAFRANVAASNTTSYGFFQGDNGILTGDESLLSDFVTDDLFVATVEVSGSYSYDTQIGGNTTVPKFLVYGIERR